MSRTCKRRVPASRVWEQRQLRLRGGEALAAPSPQAAIVCPSWTSGLGSWWHQLGEQRPEHQAVERASVEE